LLIAAETFSDDYRQQSIYNVDSLPEGSNRLKTVNITRILYRANKNVSIRYSA